MKITMYELLGMIKYDKAPKKIKYINNIYEYDNYDYFSINTGYLFDRHNISGILNYEVEILEEPKGIPEKLESYISCGWNGTCKDLKREELFEDLKKMGSKINEIIDYLESKGE